MKNWGKQELVILSGYTLYYYHTRKQSREQNSSAFKAWEKEQTYQAHLKEVRLGEEGLHCSLQELPVSKNATWVLKCLPFK